MDKPADRQIILICKSENQKIIKKRSFVFFRTRLRFKRKFNYKTL